VLPCLPPLVGRPPLSYLAISAGAEEDVELEHAREELRVRKLKHDFVSPSHAVLS
jgi:hypothetical protein